ncbi:hypothetical protein C2E25_12545 [Geothermobacter hydrogeniphilus]|uniref:histidine kinase n=1 Tax=Geothermobacter hydrogeniphilus TaxID=1969733 RepID=A0A2K2H848_9BACT|nr:transporter substrate-binding domain-containing protein [Geothermobacter hydrogeniphilus]PNU19403.1 hypothetical protein C2E25_12545 [Geothermobacter hydrogeniphilus]
MSAPAVRHSSPGSPATVFFLLFCLLLLGPVAHSAAPPLQLTNAEQSWLQHHARTIRVGMLPNYPPIEFTEQGRHQGLTADYLRLLEKRLDIHFRRIPARNWDELLQMALDHRIDLIGSIQQTPQRSRKLLFTSVYVRLPNVIITRKGGPKKLTEQQLADKKVAVVRGYASESYLRKNVPEARLVAVNSDLDGLQQLAFGKVDALVSDLSVASWNIDRLGLSNLQASGFIDFRWNLRFGIRNDWPELQKILNKALDAIPQQDKDELFRHWVGLSSEKPLNRREIVIVALALALCLLLVLAIGLWNRMLGREVRRQTLALQQALERERNARTEAAGKEAQLRELTDNLPQTVFETDCDGRITYVNNQALEWSGYSREQILSSRIQDFQHPDDQPRIEERIRALLNDDDATGRLHRICLADGRLRNTLIYARAIHSGNKPVGLRGILVDITERQQAEQELRESEERFREIFNGTTEALFIHDAGDGRILDLNHTAEIMYRGSREQLLASDIDKLSSGTAPYTGEEARVLVEKTRRDGQQVFEWHARRLDGELFWAEVSLRTTTIAGKQVIIAGVRDISQRKQMEEFMLQSEKMLTIGKLAAGIAHEINNPLAGVLQNLQILSLRLDSKGRTNQDATAETGLPPEALAAYLKRRQIPHIIDSATEAALRARTIVEDLLTFSRRPNRKHPVDLATVIKTALKLASTEYDPEQNFDFRHIRIEKRMASSLPTIQGTSDQLQQVVLNLLRNAAQAMIEAGTEKPTISITLEQHDQHILLQIKDNGPGMDEQTRLRIFEPFFSTRLGRGGTGLGLALVSYIVHQNHGGSISVESSPGRGCCFSIRLPIPREDS